MIIYKSHLAEKTALPVKEASHFSLLVSLVFSHVENIIMCNPNPNYIKL